MLRTSSRHHRVKFPRKFTWMHETSAHPHTYVLHFVLHIHYNGFANKRYRICYAYRTIYSMCISIHQVLVPHKIIIEKPYPFAVRNIYIYIYMIAHMMHISAKHTHTSFIYGNCDRRWIDLFAVFILMLLGYVVLCVVGRCVICEIHIQYRSRTLKINV